MNNYQTDHIERILESAFSLYTSYGIKSITMDDLCKETGISKKTLYTVVKDKKDLVQKVIDNEKQSQIKRLDTMFTAGTNAIDELISMNQYIHKHQGNYSPTFYFDLKKNFSGIYRQWMQEKRQMMHDMILENLDKGIRQGLYRTDLVPATIAKLHLLRSEMMHSSEVIERNESMKSDFIDEVFRYHIHGICNEEGLSYYKNQQSQIQ